MQVNKSVVYDLINPYLRLCRSPCQFVVSSCALTLVETVKLCCFSVSHDTCITTGGNSTHPYVLDITVNKNCTVMKGDGTWYNRSCGADRAFICYDGEKPSYSLTLEDRQLNYASKQISWL